MAEIADLRERLREEWLRKATSSFTCQECGIQANFINEIIDALDATQDGGWRPIESAPKDGTKVDVWVRSWDAFPNGNAARITNAWFDDGKWKRVLAGWTHDIEGCGEPTHWMPLPLLPPFPPVIAMDKRVETKRQETLDGFYFAHGPCCAGCDWWRNLNSLIGECQRSAPTSGEARLAMLGIYGSSLNFGAGHAVTERDHHCGEFKDEFDWASLPLPYRTRIGYRPLPAHKEQAE